MSPPILRSLDGILSSPVALFVAIFLNRVRMSLMVISRKLKELLVCFTWVSGSTSELGILLARSSLILVR